MICWWRYFSAHRYWRKADRLWNRGDRKLAILWYVKAIQTNPDVYETGKWIYLAQLKCRLLQYEIEV